MSYLEPSRAKGNKDQKRAILLAPHSRTLGVRDALTVNPFVCLLASSSCSRLFRTQKQGFEPTSSGLTLQALSTSRGFNHLGHRCTHELMEKQFDETGGIQNHGQSTPYVALYPLEASSVVQSLTMTSTTTGASLRHKFETCTKLKT